MASKRDAARGSESYKLGKCINMFLYDTGRWGAWVREPKVGGKRVFVGTHLTERLAARCQDRALLKMEMNSSMTQAIKLNFDRGDYEEDEHMRNTMPTADFLAYLSGESRGTYNQYVPTACLNKFLAEELALGNLAPEGAPAIFAPQPASEGNTSRSTDKKPKKLELKDEPAGEDDSAEEGLTDESALQVGENLAFVPHVDAPEPPASVAPTSPSPKKSRKRRIINPTESVASFSPMPQFPRQVSDWTLSELEVDTLAALLALANGPPTVKPSPYSGTQNSG